jgi:hypothetical protein
LQVKGLRLQKKWQISHRGTENTEKIKPRGSSPGEIIITGKHRPYGGAGSVMALKKGNVPFPLSPPWQLTPALKGGVSKSTKTVADTTWTMKNEMV